MASTSISRGSSSSASSAPFELAYPDANSPIVLILQIAAQRVRAKPQAAGPALLAGVGTALWMAVCLAQCDGLTATAGWLIGVAALLGLERFGRTQRYFEIALFTLVLIAAKWLAFDALTERMNPSWRATDACGNQATCSQTVVVIGRSGIDRAAITAALTVS